jgi:hypothetical protein
MFCTLGLIFNGTEGIVSHFYVLRVHTHFRRYRGRPVSSSCFALPDIFLAVRRAYPPFSCFALQDTFLAVRRVSSPIFMFCAPGLIFGGSEGVRSRFLFLRTRTHFQRYGECRVPFSCFTPPDSFSAVQRASAPVFMFYAPGLDFGGIEGVVSHFHVLRSRTHFRR